LYNADALLLSDEFVNLKTYMIVRVLNYFWMCYV